MWNISGARSILNFSDSLNHNQHTLRPYRIVLYTAPALSAFGRYLFKYKPPNRLCHSVCVCVCVCVFTPPLPWDGGTA